MTTELTMLAASAGLAWVLIMTAALPSILTNGMGWALGNRAEAGPSAPWIERAKRAHANLQENLIIFAILVLVVHVSGRSNDASATGAVIFFVTRVAHGLVYVAGIPGLRTLVWAVSVVGMFMVATALLA